MRIPSKSFYFTRKLFLFAASALCSVLALWQIRTLDIWLHIRTGQWIWVNLSLPRTQLYSFMLGRKQWINHEWLFQVIIFPVYKFFGENGVVFFRFAIICVILIIITKILDIRQRYFTFSLIVIMLSMRTAASRFIDRPELFSLLFIIIYIYKLKKFKGANSIFLLVPLQLLWVNMHGYSIIGPFLIGLFFLIRFIQSKLKLPFNWNNYSVYGFSLQKAAMFFLLMMLTIFLTPNFIQGGYYPIGLLIKYISEFLSGNNYTFSVIQELQPIPVSEILLSDIRFPLLMLITLFFFSLLVNIRRVDIFDIVIFVVFLVLTVLAKRHIGMFALTVGILAIFNFNIGSKRLLPQFFKARKNLNRNIFIFIKISGIVLFVLCFVGLSYSYARVFNMKYIHNMKGENKSVFFGKNESALNYSKGAISFLQKKQIKGNIFNILDNAAYLIGHVYPDCQIFIDGRTEVYGNEALKLEERIFDDPRMLDELSKEYNIECAIIPCQARVGVSRLFIYLYTSSKWDLVFFDGSSSVFLNEASEFKESLKDAINLNEFSIRLDSNIITEAKRGSIFPIYFINLARFFFFINMPEKSLEAINIAEAIYPNSYDVYIIKGVNLARLGKEKEAYAVFNRAAKMNPGDIANFINIGTLYRQAGYPEIARKYFEEGLKVNPDSKELKHVLALTN